ncbi:MAG TPA: NAD(P)H-binding protein [Streptosporangiaceae bacterium]|nr:NAD(P)H-binding protein [Streptosporangiaceae bacterium]
MVTGGTGTLGRLVVQQLGDAGRAVRVLTRRGPRPGAGADGVQFMTGDLRAGAGIEPAADGVPAIVHCASDSKGDAEATRNLVRAARAGGGKPHLVYISIVGADRVTFGYVRAKLEAEHIVADSGLPWTTLRATQFYDLILNGTRKLARLPVVPVPAGFPTQPVDAGEVAARLAELTLGEPAGRVPDMAGPQVLGFADLVCGYLRATRHRRPVMPVWLPGLRRIRDGALLPEPSAETLIGTRTWEGFLADRLG